MENWRVAVNFVKATVEGETTVRGYVIIVRMKVRQKIFGECYSTPWTLYSVYTLLGVYWTSCIHYSVYTVLGLSCTSCIPYLVYTGLRVFCTWCILFLVYTVHGVYCTRCILYSVYDVISVNWWSIYSEIERDDWNLYASMMVGMWTRKRDREWRWYNIEDKREYEKWKVLLDWLGFDNCVLVMSPAGLDVVSSISEMVTCL